MATPTGIDPETLHLLDPDRMWEKIGSMGDHLIDAERRSYESLVGLKIIGASIRNIIVAGMGGSAVGGELVASYLRGELRVPMFVNRSYNLPEWAGRSAEPQNTLVIAVSYSGGTEETLAQYAEAKERKIPVICITTGGKLAELARAAGDPIILVPGGMQPRAALAYSLIPILVILFELELIPNRVHSIKVAGEHLRYLATIYGPTASEESNLPVKLAAKLFDKIAIVYSGDNLSAVNYRWRGQFHENAKHFAFGNVLPELGHIEISGWQFPQAMLEHFSAVFLRSREDEHPQVSKKLEVIKSMLVARGILVHEYEATGSTKLDRLFSLIALADWTSYYLALLSGVNPTPIPAIEAFKKALEP
jgi:glucose/mannose-6-phosphate isomerase